MRWRGRSTAHRRAGCRSGGHGCSFRALWHLCLGRAGGCGSAGPVQAGLPGQRPGRFAGTLLDCQNSSHAQTCSLCMACSATAGRRTVRHLAVAGGLANCHRDHLVGLFGLPLRGPGGASGVAAERGNSGSASGRRADMPTPGPRSSSVFPFGLGLTAASLCRPTAGIPRLDCPRCLIMAGLSAGLR